MKMLMKTTQKISIYCFAVIYLATLTINIYGGVCCIEENGQAKMEFACNPCCNEEDNKCTDDIPGMTETDHVGCENCTDFLVENVGMLRPLSTKRFTGESYLNVLSIFPGFSSYFDVTEKYSLGPPVVLPSLGIAQASLVVLRC